MAQDDVDGLQIMNRDGDWVEGDVYLANMTAW
ncbi:hypothetical protein [Mesorhizobium sp. M1339]